MACSTLADCAVLNNTVKINFISLNFVFIHVLYIVPLLYLVFPFLPLSYSISIILVIKTSVTITHCVATDWEYSGKTVLSNACSTLVCVCGCIAYVQYNYCLFLSLSLVRSIISGATLGSSCWGFFSWLWLVVGKTPSPSHFNVGALFFFVSIGEKNIVSLRQ